jgi:predicted transcriptional regulator
MNTNFDQIVRFRAPSELKRRLAVVAAHRTKKTHEVAREAIVAFVEREEERLGLNRANETAVAA